MKFRHSLLAGAMLLPCLSAFADGQIMMQSLSPMSGFGENKVGQTIHFEAGMPFLGEESEGDVLLLQGLIGALTDGAEASAVSVILADSGDVAMRYDPVTKIFYIDGPEGKALHVAVANVEGQVVFNHVFPSGSAQIDMADYAANIYMVGCSIENQILKTQKILIK